MKEARRSKENVLKRVSCIHAVDARTGAGRSVSQSGVTEDVP